MRAQTLAASDATGTTRRFYRPELDALRFFSFLGVLMVHGPSFPGFSDNIRIAGGFGLSMFFLLSAYLITELLLREREQSGTIAWGFFFTRRALRIWPLYYAALAVGIAISHIPPYQYWITQWGIVSMFFFFFNWVERNQVSFLLGPLWSISVEEQFYLIWPPIVKFGGKKLAFAAAIFFVAFACVWLWVFSAKGSATWFDAPVQFLFFAAGVMIALATHSNREYVLPGALRTALVIAGLFTLTLGSRVGGMIVFTPGLTLARLYAGYGLGVAGCTTIFLAVLGIRHIPRALTYLGKISYGLYVFHSGVLLFLRWLTEPLRLSPHRTLRIFMVDGLALLLCILLAHLSYQYFEKPFLRLKERFEVVKSRPA